jgi:ribonucleoside-diphosphate reductase alpha chain
MLPKSAVKVDYTRDSLFDEMGLRRLKDSYMHDGEESPQDRFAYIARMFGSNKEHAQRLYDYSSKHWLSYSTPILSFHKERGGMPISCFLAYIEDSASGLVDTMGEVAWLSIYGGGVGLGVGIRSEDTKSVGVMPHMKVYEAVSLAYRQGRTRRGSFAPYLDISHPNILEFVGMRRPTGDSNMRCLELHHGINVTDKFMQLIEQSMLDADCDDSWSLIDPHTQKVVEIISARQLWESILEGSRMRTGEPFLHFIDASNRGLPEYQKRLGLKVTQSNICTEITLATDKDRTAVCCLSSLNLVYWDVWKDNAQFYHDVAEMLDNVLEYFIKKAPKTVKRAVYSAKRERAIGIGSLGFHALLQKKNIPFESALATSVNLEIFKKYDKYTKRANKALGETRGSNLDAIEGGHKQPERFSHMLAIAPNATSSIIMGNTSPSIEPFRGNAYRQDTLSGLFLNKNPYLEDIINKRFSKERADEIWSNIVANAGSVQHLTKEFSEWERDVFKTASEIDQMWIIQHAADRQKYIDQSQSVNLFFKANTNIGYLHHVHFQAWKKGLKTLYYCRSDKIYHGESVSKTATREEFKFTKTVEEDCVACEG